MNIIQIKTWNELSLTELEQMNTSHNREWQIGPMSSQNHRENVFFLLKDESDTILAQGQLVPVDGVRFQNEIFNIFGIGGIIANVKGKGYGSTIMTAVTTYLKKHKKTGVGFTGFGGFYEKCGLSVNKEVINRLVFQEGNNVSINTESDRVCYVDSDDRFIEKLLNNPQEVAYLPRTPDW